MGYAIITLDSMSVSKVYYRQRTSNNSFRIGVDFSDTDSGSVLINGSKRDYQPAPSSVNQAPDNVSLKLKTVTLMKKLSLAVILRLLIYCQLIVR